MPSPTTCRACRDRVAPGDGLVIEVVTSGRRYAVHRPDSVAACFRTATSDATVHRIVGYVGLVDDGARPRKPSAWKAGAKT